MDSWEQVFFFFFFFFFFRATRLSQKDCLRATGGQ
ncbi:mCG1040565 [Mus musculus]|nr:mCG1040565 [Mus musculus]